MVRRLDPDYVEKVRRLDQHVRELACREFDMTLRIPVNTTSPPSSGPTIYIQGEVDKENAAIVLEQPLLPPNNAKELASVVELIHLDYTRLFRWYVLALIQQIHLWSIHGDQDQRYDARQLATKIGEALVLSPGRGRPEGSRGKTPQVTAAEVRTRLAENVRIVKGIWEDSPDKSVPGRLNALREAFGADIITEAVGAGPADFPDSTMAYPKSIAKRITRAQFTLSRRDLKRLLSEPA